MYDDRWELVDGFMRYEFALGWGRGAPVPASMFFGLRDWLGSPWNRWILLEIVDRLGGVGVRSWRSPDSTDPDEAIAELLIEAVERGRLEVTEHESRPRPMVLPRQEIILKPLENYVEERVDLTLEVRTLSGDPMEDEAGFLLVNPDNTREYGKLSGGSFTRSSVVPGAYQVRFKYLHQARWSAPSIHPGDEVTMEVEARGFEEGAEVTFRVHEDSQSWDGEPLAEVKAKVKGEKASATWRHVQELGSPAHRECIFEVESGNKWVSSGLLTIEPHHASTIVGVKERLIELGYDCGQPGPEETPELERALREFQELHGFPAPTGRADPETTEALEGLL